MNKEYSRYDLKIATTNRKESVNKDGEKKVKWVAKLKGDDPKTTVKISTSSKEEMDDLLGGVRLDKSLNMVIGTNQTTLDEHAD